VGGLHEVLALIAKHGALLLFAWVGAESLGIPLPAAPILIAAGVLSATGQLSLANSFALGILACLIGDSAWYLIGKSRGPAVLHTLCRISLEPDSCVRRSSNLISRYGSRSLLFAKFIPGVSAVAVPLAANSGTSLLSFAIHDFLGSALYVSAYLALGRLLGDRIDRLAVFTDSVRTVSTGFAVAGALTIVGWRCQQRRRLRDDLRTARISPEEVRSLIEQGQHPYIVDLRHPLDMLPDPRVIPGAIRMTPDELAARQGELPRDREIILYCT